MNHKTVKDVFTLSKKEKVLTYNLKERLLYYFYFPKYFFKCAIFERDPECIAILICILSWWFVIPMCFISVDI